MKLSLKHKLLFAFCFAVYLFLVDLFFGADQFLDPEVNFVLYSILLLLSVTVNQFLLFQIQDLLALKEQKARVYFAGSFVLSSFISAGTLWIILSTGKGHFLVFASAFLITALLPVLLSILLFILQDAETRISASVISNDLQETGSAHHVRTFVLENETGKQILKVTTDRLICFEANDNYVITYYLDKQGELKKSMDRVSLKKIDDILHQSGIQFERVHKSYIVNPEYIQSVKGKAQAYKLQLRYFDALIPVSRSYDVNAIQLKD